METEKQKLHTLIPLDKFKSLFGVDDREDKLCRFCIVTSTLTIEQYCKRRLLRKKHFERIGFYGDLFLPINEYPITEVLGVYLYGNGEILEPDFYDINPDCGTEYDLPFSLSLSPIVRRYRNLRAIKITYSAGYHRNNVPGDLTAACYELAAWNMNRYRGRRIGMTGNVRGSGKDGEHFEMSMPENVKALLEPYRRKLI
jgi:hypothetical protein